MSMTPQSHATPEPNPTVPEPSLRQKLAASGLSIVVFLVAYVLSAGPLVGVQHILKFKPFQRCLEFLYMPLVFLVKAEVPVLGPLLKWYVDLFR